MKHSQSFKDSPIHSSTVKLTKEQNEKGLYYNASYEIENFLQLYSDDSEGDPFKVLNDPTYTGFKLFFHFDATSGLLADERYENSALAYLKRIGQDGRYELLKRFITVLSKVNSITPWMFQEITGLQEMYVQKRSEPLFNHEIQIHTLETIDGKIQSLNQMYREICFDSFRWVHVLPENLRKFSMSVYIYDFRVFDNLSTTASDFLQTIKNTDIRELNHTMFDLGHCQFTEASGSSYFDSVTNNRSEANTSDLTIKVEAMVMSSLFKSITGDARLTAQALEVTKVGTGKKTLAGKFISRLKDRALSSAIVTTAMDKFNDLTSLDNWKKKLANAAGEALEGLIDRAESALTGLYLGNVNGFGFDDLLRMHDTNFRTTFTQKFGSVPGTQSLQLGNNKRDDLGHVNSK